MAGNAIEGTWTQDVRPIPDCRRLMLHRVNYQGTDNEPKQCSGLHWVNRPGHERGGAAREERVVCIVKGYASCFQQDPFILLLASYKPLLDQVCLTLPSDCVSRSETTNWTETVSSILRKTTGDRPKVTSVSVTGKSVGGPHVAPERVKVVSAELWTPRCSSHFRNGPKRRDATAHGYAPVPPNKVKGGNPVAHSLCFLPVNNASGALKELRGRFDAVDSEVEVLVHALAAAGPPWTYRSACFTGLAGFAVGCMVTLVTYYLGSTAPARSSQSGAPRRWYR